MKIKSLLAMLLAAALLLTGVAMMEEAPEKIVCQNDDSEVFDVVPFGESEEEIISDAVEETVEEEEDISLEAMYMNAEQNESENAQPKEIEIEGTKDNDDEILIAAASDNNYDETGSLFTITGPGYESVNGKKVLRAGSYVDINWHSYYSTKNTRGKVTVSLNGENIGSTSFSSPTFNGTYRLQLKDTYVGTVQIGVLCYDMPSNAQTRNYTSSLKLDVIPPYISGINVFTSLDEVNPHDGIYYLLNIGESMTIPVEIYPSNAWIKRLDYKSNDENIIIVNEEGVVTALADGKTSVTISALDGSGKYTYVFFRVSHTHDLEYYQRIPPTCTEEGLAPGSMCRICGKQTGMEIIPPTGHTPVTDYAVAATYTKTGLTQGSHCSVCGQVIVAQRVTPVLTKPTPTPKPIPVITVAKKSAKATVYVGTQYRINLNGAVAKSYKSSKGKVAVVDGTGLITPRAAGKAKITIKVGKKKRTLTLTVKDPTIPTRVTLNMAGTVAAKKGTSVTLKATLPAGTYSGITWKSSNKKVATVVNGVVTFKKKGKVTITATAVRGKKKAKVKFKVSN